MRKLISVLVLAGAMTALGDGLPAGYTQLPYLKANKNVQVKTGYTPKSTDKIVMTWCPTQVTATEALWCARSAVGTAAFTAFQYNSSKVGVLYNSGSTDTDTSTATVTVKKRDPVVAYTKYTIIADGNAGTVAVTNAFTGAEVANCSFTISSSFTVGSQLCLFASHATSAATANGNWSSHFLYSFKVYDAAGTLKLDLVPAKNSSGTVGLYDTVGGSFKTKSTSTGSLTDALIDKTFDDFTLIDDEVFGKVTVNSGKTLNLNGHNLTASDIAGSGTITDTMVDLTEPDSNGNHVWCTNAMYSTSVPANLFNNNYARANTDNTKRLIMPTSSLPLEVDYDFWSPRVVNAYKLYCGPGATNRNPKDWALYGSNDKENWTPLHSRSGENLSGDSKAVQTRSYTFDNTTAYRYYRFKGIACRENGYFEMVQLEYFYSHTGELHLNVPSGKTVNNSTVSLTGKFKLVKEGEGAYIAAKASQTYSGGTELRGGSIDASSADLANPFGSVATVDVYSSLDVHALNFSKFVMKDGSTLDLTGCDAAFDSAGMTFASGANVSVDVTGRTIETGTRIVEWGAKPQNVTFAFVPSGDEPVVGGTGLFYGLVGNDAEFAWWTGTGHDGDPTNPANWACTNAAGNVIADGLPSSPTTVFFAGDVSVQTPSGYNLAPYRCVVKDCILTADSDLRGFGTVEIASGCTLNLNGHKLHVSDVSGTGTIIGNEIAPDHSLDLTVPDSSRVSCDNTFYGTSVAANLFNNNYARASTDNTKRIIIATANLPLVVDYDMATPQIVNMYRMYCGPMDGVQSRCPKDWEFYGSNDEENLVLLDSRSDVTWPTEQTTRSYCFYNTTPYRYYRFKGIASRETANSNSYYFEMVQLEYFYQSVAGELHLHVPAGVTNTNSTVLFDGNLKLVKEGDGTFVAAKTGQQYSGGTDILGGTVKCATGAQDQLLGVQLSQILVASGAVLDVCDSTRIYSYKVVSDGGTLTNSGSGLGSGVAQLGSLTLTADTVLDSTHSLGLVNASYAPTLLDLGGQTLDVNTGSGGVFRMTNCDASNGTVRVTTTGAGIISFVNGEVRATTVDFDLSCVLNPDSPTTTVRNLLLRAPCATLENKLTISVFGRFKTETLDFPNVRLEDGSTLDLSAQEGALSTAGSSTHASQYYLTFSPNATIAVDVGARNVAVGDCLVSWPAGFAPAASVKFVLCANGVPVEGKVLAVVESDDRHGIYVKESGTPDYAMWDNGWKFYTQDGEEVTGWTDGVTSNMQVRFSTAAEYTAFCNAGAVTPSAFVLTADSLTIPAGTTVDLDRTGTISVNEGTVFDVNGGHLKLPASLAGGLKAFTVTNSAEQVGTLEIAVAEGEACVNTLMALTGNLMFLKTGVGTFTASKSGQTYSGGTAVEGGVLASGLPGSSHPFGTDFGTGGVNLLQNGSFDEGEVTANSGNYGYFASNGATNPNWNMDGGGGLTVAGNTWLGSGNPNIGKYALYIQKNGKVYQDVNISASGYYDWSFNCAKRTKYTGNAMEVYLIKLDGGGNETVTNRLASTTPGNDNFWRYGGTVKIDEPGTYRLMIYQPAASADVSNCYDDFVLRPTADTGRITVSSGGTFDFNGMRDFFNYQLALDGGTARNAGADVPNGAAQIGSVIVTAEGSRFEAQNNIGLINYGFRQSQLDLRGHALTVDIASGKSFWLYNTVVNDGTLDVIGAGTLDIDKTAIVATNASFRIGSAMNLKVPVSVRDYIALFAGNNGIGTAALNVYGMFKPSAHNYFYGPTMQDGSTIDLSARTSPMPLVSDAWDGERSLKFASGATVTIGVGDRAATLARGARLMSWSEIPAGITFTFGPEATQAGITPFLTATGLFYGEGSSVAEFAWWTGAGNDGDPTNSENWRCVNASGDEIEDGLPSSSTIVYLGGDTASEITLQPSAGYDVVPSKCVVSNCTLAADCDWRVFGTLEIASGCTVYLNGHKLYATGVAGIGTIAGSSDLTEPDVNGNHVSCNNTLYSTSVAANLFNNNYVRAGTDNTKRLIIDNANLPLVVDYDFGVGTVVNCYNIYTGPDDGGRRPKSWEFYGSNDKENWTLLDSHIGVIWPTNPQMTRAFAFENATPYRYYRFKGIESQDAGYFEMVQLEYFGPVQDELHLDIPAGATLINDSVLLTGHMKLVKEGEGTYIGRNQSQSYSGGTLIAAGKAQPGLGAAANSSTGYLYRKPFGFGSVTVAQGATFDVRSNYDYVMQEFIVEGGTFQSTGVDMTKPEWSGAAIRKLTADSNLGVTNSLIFGTGTMDLGGNTLSVNITPAKTLYLRGTVITNGTIDITRGGTLNVIGAATDARTVDFRVNCALNVGAALSVHDYEAAYSYNANGGTAALNVYGAFKPTVGCYYGPTLQDGSTLDLSAWPGSWPVASGFTAGNTAIRFADGATVKVKIGARRVGRSNGTKILDWTTAPANVDFVPAEGERIGLRKKDDGLYLYKGMIIYVR